MRMSDRGSDGCSSVRPSQVRAQEPDQEAGHAVLAPLADVHKLVAHKALRAHRRAPHEHEATQRRRCRPRGREARDDDHRSVAPPDLHVTDPVRSPSTRRAGASEEAAGEGLAVRSEEHTSELQSLMRISYAVFCLKKKINIEMTASIQRS